VAGAISTATHGTGARLGNLATQVEELDLVLADGSLLRCAPGSDELRAARVSLGALGVLATVTLRVVPAFRLRAEDRPRPLADTLAELDEHVGGADHFEFYVFPHSDRALTRTNTRTDAPAAPRGRLRRFLDEELVPNDLLGAVCRLGRRFPAAVPRLNRQVAAAFAASVLTDVSHRVFTSPRRVRFTEMEWALPRAACEPVLRAALRAAERHVVNFPIEVRFTAADDESFLSPSWCRDTAYVAVHAFDGMPWEAYFRDVQDVALAHDGRPHWGKRHLLDAAALAPRYPAWDHFQAVRNRLDPDRRFTNAHVARVLGA
jgi:L-gulono-1,4-lactone dehydrogenase